MGLIGTNNPKWLHLVYMTTSQLGERAGPDLDKPRTFLEVERLEGRFVLGTVAQTGRAARLYAGVSAVRYRSVPLAYRGDAALGVHGN